MSQPEAHFDQLIHLLELERRAERERLAADRAALPLGELEERGLVFLDAHAVEESVGLGGRVLVTLAHADHRPFRSVPAQGELIEVRPRKAEVEHPGRAVVTRASRMRIQLAFDRPPPPFVSEGRLRLDRVANDITFDRARTAVQRTQAWESGQARDKRDILLGQRPPRFEKAVPFQSAQPLNPEQREAVSMALAARDFFLVHGPPGTGKSTVLAEVAVQAVRSGKRLLCTAASNAAVDHLLELCLGQGIRALRLGHPARVLPHLQEHTLDLVVEDHPDRKLARELFDEAFELQGYARRQRTRGRSRERFANARESAAEARRLIEEARALERRAVHGVLQSAQALCATCSTLDSGHLAGASFDLALLDEATQVIEPLALGAFLKAPTVILAGDHRQLPPTVLSEQAAAAGLARSLFERLLAEHGDGVKRMLREQYRMNERIMEYPSRQMYEGMLRAHPSVAQHTLGELLTGHLEAAPVVFLDTAGKGFEEEQVAGTSSLRNAGEAQLVVSWARTLMNAGLGSRQLAIIAPYRAQAQLIAEQLAQPEVEVDTVDAFQGREKEAVLVSLTRSNSEGQLGFLTDLRRMNVAMTRARRHLLMVGDSATLAGHPFYAGLVEHAQTTGAYRSAWEWRCD